MGSEQALSREKPALHKTDCYVEKLLHRIGAFESSANEPALDARTMDRFAKRELEFHWVHMGNSELRIEKLFDVISETPHLLPPRTGHIGNWDNIVRGCAGDRDYNHLACRGRRLGYPLIFDFNQTEAGGGAGDWSYLPGSLVDGDNCAELQLCSWDGTGFAARDRSEPLFTPFTLAQTDGELIPLLRLHRDRLKELNQFDFCIQSSLLARNELLVRNLLRISLEGARLQEQPQQLLRRILDRSVCLDGRVTRQTLEPSGQGFRMGESYYADVEELIDHTLLPVLIASSPDSYQDLVTQLPRQLPLISAPFLVMVIAVLTTQYPKLESMPGRLTQPCNPHLHWGGIPMAGAPPLERGYFNESARHLRKIFRLLVSNEATIDPVFFVLLPSGVFNLCPHSAFPHDLELLTDLFERVRARTDHVVANPNEMMRVIEKITKEWLKRSSTALSEYFVDRFRPRSAQSAMRPSVEEGEPVLLPAFEALALRQASMIMGALGRLHQPDL